MNRLVLSLAAGLLAVGTGAAQERGDKTVSCDLKETVKGLWCKSCNAEVSKADVKDKKHVKDDGDVVDAKFCVKKSYEGC